MVMKHEHEKKNTHALDQHSRNKYKLGRRGIFTYILRPKNWKVGVS